MRWPKGAPCPNCAPAPCRSQAEIDSLAQQPVESGLALWENAGSSERLIVRGRSNLIGEAADRGGDRPGFAFCSTTWSASATSPKFLNLTEAGEGVRIFIGSENKLFHFPVQVWWFLPI